MAGAAAIAATVGTVPTGPHPYGLYINGLDVIKDAQGRYGAQDIEIAEAGPGDVSLMHFTIDDPTAMITVPDGAEIILWNFTTNRPEFGGFLSKPATRNDFGDQGRSIVVECIGYESLLDTIIVASKTFHTADFGDSFGSAWQSLFTAMSLGGYLPLRTGALTNQPSQAYPLGRISGSVLAADVDVSGKSVREAWAAALAVGDDGGAGYHDVLTVDFWRGLRRWIWGGSAGLVYAPTDYDGLALNDTPGGATAATNLTYTRDLSQVVTAVYVSGAAAASTGWVTGDTSTGRHEEYTTTTGTTEAAKQIAAAAIMTPNRTAIGRGSFELRSFDPSLGNFHPGGTVVITDSRQGWTAKTFLISRIEKTLNPGLTQNWTVYFFDPGESPSTGPGTFGQTFRSVIQ